MPQAIKLIDAECRSCIYVPITQDGKMVDSQEYAFDPEDEPKTKFGSGFDATGTITAQA